MIDILDKQYGSISIKSTLKTDIGKRVYGKLLYGECAA